MQANRRFLTYLLAAGVGTFLFSDFYFPGIARAFDYVFLGMVCLSLYFVPFRFNTRHVWIFLAAFGAMLPWIVAGAISGALLMAVSMTLGVLLGSTIFTKHALEYQNEFDRFLKLGVVFCLAVFWVQFLLHYTMGFYLDFHSVVGSVTSRGWNVDLNYFRASGLFQEPNAYCTVLFCMLSTRTLVFHKVDWTFFVGLISMFASLSLWGIGGALLLALLVFRPITSLKIIGIGVLCVATVIYFSGISVDSLVEDSITLHRITNLDDDASKQGRFGTVENYLTYRNLIFGSGVSSDQFQALAANAYGFLFYAFGILGVSLLALSFSTLLAQNWRGVVAILFLLTTFPHFSYMFFWIWIALMVNASASVSLARR
jgi:hypothetical protein